MDPAVSCGELRVSIRSYAVQHGHTGPAGVEVRGVLTDGVRSEAASWTSNEAESQVMKFPVSDLASDLRLTIFDASVQRSPSDNSEAGAALGVGVVSLSQLFQDCKASALLLNQEFRMTVQLELLPKQVLTRAVVDKQAARIRLQAAEPGTGIPRPRILLGQIVADLSLSLSAAPAKLFLKPPPNVVQTPPDWTVMDLSALDSSLGRLKCELKRIECAFHNPSQWCGVLQDILQYPIMAVVLFLVWTYWVLMAPTCLWLPGAWVVASIWVMRSPEHSNPVEVNDVPFWEDECETPGSPEMVAQTLRQARRVLNRIVDAAHVVGWIARAVECTLMALSFEDPICSWAVLGLLGMAALFASLVLYFWNALFWMCRVFVWGTGAVAFMPAGKEKVVDPLVLLVAPFQPRIQSALAAVSAVLLRIPDSSEARHRRLCSRFATPGIYPDPSTFSAASQNPSGSGARSTPFERSESNVSIASSLEESPRAARHDFFSESY